MKQFKFSTLYALSIFLFIVVGCTKQDDGSMGGGNVDGPITLDCSVDSDLTLMNHNANGVDYILDCNLIVNTDLVIEAGTTIQINDGHSITVRQDGSLSAVGTAEMPVSFKGASGSGATWEYIIINTSNAKNRFNHVLIENAGNNQGWDSLRDDISAVYLEGRLSMTNTTINGSNGIGLMVTDILNPSTLSEFSNNIFRNTASYPISVTPSVADGIDFASCTFSDNDESFIRIFDSSSASDVDEDVTWERAPLPYFVDANIRIYGSITIESGSEFIFSSGAGINVYNGQNGYLKIDGTDANHVIMRGEVATAAAWLGLLVNSTNVQNIFSYLDIADGGQRNLPLVDLKGNIVLNNSNGRLTLNDCTSTRAECDVVIDTSLGNNQILENNSPSISNVCMD